MKRLGEIQSDVREVRSQEKLGKQVYHYDAKEIFEPIRKAVINLSEKLLEESKPTLEAIKEVYESNVHVKALELLLKKGIFSLSLIRPLEKHIVPQNKSQFWLYDDADSENWSDFIMNGEK